MAKHIKLHKTDKELHQCQQCNAELSSKGNLKEHMFIHSDQQKMTTCKVCNIQIQQGRLHNHLMTHDPRTYPCPAEDCNKRFMKKSSIKGHLLVHTQESKKECQV